jgi:transposase
LPVSRLISSRGSSTRQSRFNKAKPHRRIATRYDKPAANYLGFIKLAAIRIWLRIYESTP